MQAALRRLEAAPRRRQVRRVRRDRHRQPREDRHPVDRDPVLARRRDRAAEPVGAHARQHAASRKVLLLGGPNTYLPFLQDCWRQRIPETWDERGYDYPKDVPDRGADLRARERAVLRRVRRGACTACTSRPTSARYARHRRPRGLHRPTAARRKLGETRRARRSSQSDDELDGVPRAVQDPEVRRRRRSSPGRSSAASSASTAARPRRRRCSSTRTSNILKKAYQLSKGNPIQDTKELLARPAGAGSTDQGAHARGASASAPPATPPTCSRSRVQADVNIVETVAHMMSGGALLRRRRRHLRHRRAGHQGPVHAERRHQELPPVEPVLGRQRHAAAGDGRPVRRARSPSTPTPRSRPSSRPKFSYGCAVFLDTDRVNFQKEGYSKEELLAGLAQVLPKNVWQYVVQIPRMAALGHEVRAAGRHAVQPRRGQGAGRLHQGARARTPRCYVHPHTRRGRRDRRGVRDAARGQAPRARRRFIGLDAGDRPRVHGEERREHALPLLPEQLRAHVHRHQDARRPTRAATSRGFSCEKGTVESRRGDARARPPSARSSTKQFPNLVDYEAKLAVPPLLRAGADARADGTPIEDVEVAQDAARRVKRRRDRRAPFQRSSAEAARARAPHAHRHPARAQHLLDGAVLAHLLRGARHPASRTSCSATTTTEEMWVEGGKYGSIDPCFPSKVGAGAHPQPALPPPQRREAAQLHLLPVLTHVPTFVQNDAWTRRRARSWPGAPNVMKAAFTKEIDFFAQRGIEYLDPALTFIEPHLLQAADVRDAGASASASPRTRATSPADEAFEGAAPASTRRCRTRAARSSRRSRRENRVGDPVLGRPVPPRSRA